MCCAGVRQLLGVCDSVAVCMGCAASGRLGEEGGRGCCGLVVCVYFSKGGACRAAAFNRAN